MMEQTRYELATAVVREAAELLLSHRDDAIAWTEKKDHTDIVSKYDRLLEDRISARILAAFPQDGIIGEERDHPERGEWCWYIDPIDGTTNFVNQRRNYAISLGCYHSGVPEIGVVCDVEEGRLYRAKRGGGAFCDDRPLGNAKRSAIGEMILYTPIIQSTLIDDHPLREGMRRLAEDVRAVRSLGSVALELCALASGEADLFIAQCSCPWDHGAAAVIVEEAGGALRTWDNEPVSMDGSVSLVAAGSRAILDRIFETYWKGQV